VGNNHEQVEWWCSRPQHVQTTTRASGLATQQYQNTTALVGLQYKHSKAGGAALLISGAGFAGQVTSSFSLQAGQRMYSWQQGT
jgi:hypothetical protein